MWFLIVKKDVFNEEKNLHFCDITYSDGWTANKVIPDISGKT